MCCPGTQDNPETTKRQNCQAEQAEGCNAQAAAPSIDGGGLLDGRRRRVRTQKKRLAANARHLLPRLADQRLHFAALLSALRSTSSLAGEGAGAAKGDGVFALEPEQ